MKDFFSSPAAVQLEAGNGAISSPENWSSLTAAPTLKVHPNREGTEKWHRSRSKQSKNTCKILEHLHESHFSDQFGKKSNKKQRSDYTGGETGEVFHHR